MQKQLRSSEATGTRSRPGNDGYTVPDWALVALCGLRPHASAIECFVELRRTPQSLYRDIYLYLGSRLCVHQSSQDSRRDYRLSLHLGIRGGAVLPWNPVLPVQVVHQVRAVSANGHLLQREFGQWRFW